MEQDQYVALLTELRAIRLATEVCAFLAKVIIGTMAFGIACAVLIALAAWRGFLTFAA